MQQQRPNQQALFRDLHKIIYLRGLDDQILAELARQAVWREYAPGAVVFLEGEANSGLHYLQFGWLKVIKSSLDGRQQTLRLLAPGETFNELSLFVDRPNLATAVALEAAGIWSIPRETMRRLLAAHPAMTVHVVENIAARMIDLVALVADLSLHTVEARLARLLLEESVAGVMSRQRWATQTELAARLGTVPDVLGRILRNLSEAGQIAVDRSEIRILDRQALERVAMLDV